MGQTCLEASLLEKEEGDMLGVCFLLSTSFISSWDCGKEEVRCSDWGRPIPGEQRGAGRGGKGRGQCLGSSQS